MRKRSEEATLCTRDWIWTGVKNSFLLHDQSSFFGSNVWSSWLNSLWYIIAFDCFIDSRRPAILCKTIIKQCFAPSVPCVVFSKPKIKKHAALPLMPDAVQSGRLTPPQLALSLPLLLLPLLLIMVQMSCFCAVVWSLVIVRGRHFLVSFL